MTVPSPWQPSEADVERARVAARNSALTATQAMHAALIAGAGPTVEALRKRVAELERTLQQVCDVIYDAPELNMGNYDEDQVFALNNAMIEAHGLLSNIQPNASAKIDAALAGGGS